MEKVKERIGEWVVKNKYNICIFLGMLFFSFVICTNFIKTHFALDTYCVYSYDSQTQISHFLASNRIFSALARWISEILNISFVTNMKLLTLAGIVFLAIAWFILYKFVINMKKKQNDVFYNILMAGITFIIIFNFCTVESLIFWESGIMCLGILCTIIASCVFNSDIKFKRIISFLVLLIGSTCYQGAITVYIPLTLVLLAYKYKDSIKNIFIETIKVGIIYVIVMVINLFATKIFSVIFNYEFRKMGILSITEILSTMVRLGYDMVIKTFGIGPQYWYVLVITVISAIFLICIFKKQKSKFHILEYIVLLASCILVPILPMLATPIENQYIESRMAMSFGASIGILILFLVLIIEADKYKIFKYLITIIVCIMVMLNAMFYIISSSENISTNYLDRNIAKTIINEIYNYQEETGIIVENIGLTFDKNPMSNYDGQRWLGVSNTRSMGIEWAAIETIEFYSGNKFNKIDVPDKYKEGLSQRDWNFFDKEQLNFDGNNLYICLY